MRRVAMNAALLLAFVSITLLSVSIADSQSQGDQESQSRIKRGFKIAPVTLNLRGKNRAHVGLGSYIVNGVSGCIDCHSCPSFAPGHNPYTGGDGMYNAANYLAGGVDFGPPPGGGDDIVSANLTPDLDGKPAGLDLDEFIQLIRTGRDPDEPGEILQVMPWPIFRHMTRNDLEAIYEYLTAIPHAEPGSCTGPGE
jgi:hypothetical protein